MKGSKSTDLLNALIRADGSRELGMGHITRCLAFAQGLEKRGIRPIFALRDYDDRIIGLIQRKGFEVKTIPGNSSLKEDALYTAEFASTYDARFIVIDLSHTRNLANLGDFTAFFNILRTAKRFVIAIDDLEKTEIPVDMQIMPYYAVEKKGYIPSGGTKLLLGLPYYISAPHFVVAARAGRIIRKKGRRIFVTFGGSDPKNVTSKVVKALLRLSMPALEVKIMIGQCFDTFVKRSLEKMLKTRRPDYRLCTEGEGMAELMLWSDLAITGEGLTKYETAITGTPSIIISQHEIEAKRMREFEGTGTAVHMGRFDMVSEDDIANEAERLLANFEKRKEMSEKGKRLIDGKGLDRIIQEMPESMPK